MTFSVYQSLRTIPADLVEAARMYRLSAWQRFWRLEMPYAMPSLVWNMMMSVSGGWFFVVASEAITVSGQTILLPGVGSYIAIAIEQRDLAAIGYALLVHADRDPAVRPAAVPAAVGVVAQVPPEEAAARRLRAPMVADRGAARPAASIWCRSLGMAMNRGDRQRVAAAAAPRRARRGGPARRRPRVGTPVRSGAAGAGRRAPACLARAVHPNRASPLVRDRLGVRARG